MTRKTLIERFQEKYIINPDTGCWDWIAFKDRQGYGRMVLRIDGKMITQRAQRVSWFLYHGEVLPSDIFTCHACDNPGCVNPDHLFRCTPSENNIDKKKKGRAKNGTQKLTVQQIKEIRERYASGNFKQSDLAQEYQVKQVTISAIVRGENWKRYPDVGPLSTGGQRKASMKINRKIAEEIRNRYNPETTSYSSLAAEYGVSPSLVYQIMKRKIWS